MEDLSLGWEGFGTLSFQIRDQNNLEGEESDLDTLSLSLSSSSLNKSNFHISAKPQSPLGSHPQCYGPNLLSFKREEKLVDPIRIPPSRARINQVGDNSNIKNLGSWRDFLMVVFVYSSTLAIPSSPQRPSGKIAVDSKMLSHAKEPVET